MIFVDSPKYFDMTDETFTLKKKGCSRAEERRALLVAAARRVLPVPGGPKKRMFRHVASETPAGFWASETPSAYLMSRLVSSRPPIFSQVTFDWWTRFETAFETSSLASPVVARPETDGRPSDEGRVLWTSLPGLPVCSTRGGAAPALKVLALARHAIALFFLTASIGPGGAAFAQR